MQGSERLGVADPDWLGAHGASPAAVTSHYDLGNDFFALWLDPELVYTCAMWSGADDASDLAAAQQRKIDYFLDAAGMGAGGRILDIGCGWGGALRRAVEARGASAAIGLTLSPSQAEFIGRRPASGLEVLVRSWVDYESDAPFDAIVSVEAIEAFARRGLSRDEKVRIYRSLFERARAWLRPGGVFGLQMIAYGQVGPERFDDFIAAEIFPESDLPRLSEVIEASEGLFELVSLRNDRGDYVRTLRFWLAALKSQRATACAIVGPAAVKRFEDYLRLSWRMFASGACDLHRLVLRRTDSPRLAPPASASL